MARQIFFFCPLLKKFAHHCHRWYSLFFLTSNSEEISAAYQMIPSDMNIVDVATRSLLQEITTQPAYLYLISVLNAALVSVKFYIHCGRPSCIFCWQHLKLSSEDHKYRAQSPEFATLFLYSPEFLVGNTMNTWELERYVSDNSKVYQTFVLKKSSIFRDGVHLIEYMCGFYTTTEHKDYCPTCKGRSWFITSAWNRCTYEMIPSRSHHLCPCCTFSI